MNLIKSVGEFLNTLTLIDIIFFVAVIVLLILVVTLIYFIKINRNVFTEDDFFPPGGGKDEEQNKQNEIKQIVAELNKSIPKKPEDYDDEEGELLDLDSLTKKLEQQEEERIDVTAYEKDQEEKAIISYDELLMKHNKYALNYEEEKTLDDVVVKKVNLNDLVNRSAEEVLNHEVRVVSYEKEEAFLMTLKGLNRLLN